MHRRILLCDAGEKKSCNKPPAIDEIQRQLPLIITSKEHMAYTAIIDVSGGEFDLEYLHEMEMKHHRITGCTRRVPSVNSQINSHHLYKLRSAKVQSAMPNSVKPIQLEGCNSVYGFPPLRVAISRAAYNSCSWLR